MIFSAIPYSPSRTGKVSLGRVKMSRKQDEFFYMYNRFIHNRQRYQNNFSLRKIIQIRLLVPSSG